MPRSREREVTDEQIIAEYAVTNNMLRASSVLGVSPQTIKRVLVKHDVPRVSQREHVIAYQRTLKECGTPYIGVYKGSKEEIVNWYVEGATVRQIADKIGRSIALVSRAIRSAGVSRPFNASGSGHSQWKGGILDAGFGYSRLWVSEDDPMASMRNGAGYVLEHRLTLARKLNRLLLPSETVHHIDGDHGNNAPENLQLRQGKHGKHIVMCCADCGSRNVTPIALD